MYDTTNTNTVAPPDEVDEEALRKRLVNRIAIAGVVIVVLLGLLAGIDSMYVASPATPSKVSAITPLVVDVAKQAEPDSLSATAVSAPEPPRPEAVPALKSHAEPEESAPPSTPVHNETRPIASSTASLAKAKPAFAAAERSAVPRPLTQPRPEAQGESRFMVQIGVFKNVSNAQELLAKLEKNGIPAQIEARVQVGPFNTRKEADDARAKLTAMGLDAGLLVPTHR